MLTKHELDRRVSLALGLKVKDVGEVTEAFISELCNALAHHGGFQLDGLGKLRPSIEQSRGGAVNDRSLGSTRIRLYFKKSVLLKEQLERQFGLKESRHAEE